VNSLVSARQASLAPRCSGINPAAPLVLGPGSRINRVQSRSIAYSTQVGRYQQWRWQDRTVLRLNIDTKTRVRLSDRSAETGAPRFKARIDIAQDAQQSLDVVAPNAVVSVLGTTLATCARSRMCGRAYGARRSRNRIDSRPRFSPVRRRRHKQMRCWNYSESNYENMACSIRAELLRHQRSRLGQA
jgi:hypothetical protein